MVQFRPAAERGQYDPPVVEDFSREMAVDSQRMVNAMAQANQQIDRVQQQEVRNASRTTQSDAALQMLSQFSKTAAAEVQRIGKQTAQDIEDGQTWASTFEGYENYEANLAEEVAAEGASMQLADAKKNAEAIEVASGSPNLAHSYYRNQGRIGKGLLNEKALLTQAKSEYAPFRTNFINSDIMIPGLGKARDIFRSDDYAAIKAATDYGRYLFIKERGLQYATKRNFVGILNETLFATEAAQNNNTLTANITRKQKDNVAAAQSNIVNEILRGAPLQNTWNDQTEQLYFQDTGLSRREANEKFMDAVVQAALIKGGQAGIDILDNSLGILQRPGVAGTEVGFTDGALKVQKAKELLQSNMEKSGKQTAQGIYQNANNIDYNLPDEQNIENLNQAAAEIRATPNGGQTAQALADQLERKAQQIGLGGVDQKISDKLLKDNIIAGVDYSPADLDALLAKGYNSGKAIAEARKLIADKKLPSTSTSRLFINNSVTDYSTNLARGTGLSFRLEDNQIIMEGTSKLTGISKEQLKGTVRTLNTQMNNLAVDVYNALPTSMDEKEKDQIVKRELREWYQQNVASENGAYNFDALKHVDWKATRSLKNLQFRKDPERKGTGQGQTLTTNVLASAPEQQAARDAAEKIQIYTPTRIAAIPAEKLRAQNLDVLEPVFWYETEFIPGQNVTPEMKATASLQRGDVFFPLTETVQALQQYVNTGTYPMYITKTADQLGKSNLALLTSQAIAYQRSGELEDFDIGKLQPYQNPTKRPVSEQVSAGEGGSEGEQQLTPYEGMQALMAAPFAFPARGAAYLSGNINTESLWDFQQDPWDDVGERAGGGISWRGQRLRDLETYYGRPVQEINTFDQLRYMVKEMTDPNAPWFYHKAYEIFTDPKATRRELIYASKLYWGYGVEGDRFTTAEELLKQNSNE